MADALRTLAALGHLQAQESQEKLLDIAADQREKLKEKRAIRDTQEYYDQVMVDETITPEEMNNLRAMSNEVGVDQNVFADGNFHHDGHWEMRRWWQFEYVEDPNISVADKENENHRANQRAMDAINDAIDGRMDDVEDDESLLQFEIQMATSDMQNAESIRSQAEKRMSDHRSEMRRNWQG